MKYFSREIFLLTEDQVVCCKTLDKHRPGLTLSHISHNTEQYQPQ